MKNLFDGAVQFAVNHRRMLALKVAVAGALVVAHYFPEPKLNLVVNLIWLVLF